MDSIISAFCYRCKAPRPPDWTTGNKSLDSFIMKSWSMIERKVDGYIQWIEFDRLKDMQEAPLLDHGCTHTANWISGLSSMEFPQPLGITVILKKIVDGKNAQSFDFYQV